MTEPATLRGVFPMLPTPFDATGYIVWEDLERVIEFELENDVHGLSALGLGAEAGLLTEQERLAVAERALSITAGRVPMIIGASAQDTATACRLARHAAEHGAAAVMVAPPSLPGIGREQLLRHYFDVAEASRPAALMVQDAPAYVGVALDADFARELAAERSNVRYVKSEAVPAGERTAELVAKAGDNLTVFGGNSALYYLDVLEAGAVGIMPGCECPREFVAIFEGYTAGRRDEAVALFQRVLPLVVFEIQTLNFFIACSKEILRRRGVLSSSALRSPWPLGSWSERALTRHVDRALMLSGQE